MSLRAFHILFIALSILLCFGFGIWTIKDYFVHHNAMRLALGLGSFGAGGLLIWYLYRVFLRE